MDALEQIFEGTGLEYSKPERPYPGLRPFEKSEWPIFFGREKMSGEIIDRLIADHLVVVHGDSGGGKSSVARAGVQAQLEREHARNGNRWHTVTAMPGNAPLNELAEALASLKPDDRDGFLAARRILNTGRDAAAEIAGFLGPAKDDYFCIVIDQFEELFDFVRRNPDGYAEAKLLVDFLIGLAQTKEPKLYVMLTMRSDYVGACAQFRDFAEVVNETLYLLSGMSDGALMRAVRDPGPAYGVEFSSELARELIAAAGRGQDKLPLLQHGLLRIYEAHEKQIAALPEDQRPLRLTKADDIDKDLAGLLSSHGNNVWRTAVTDGEIDNLPDDQREWFAQKVFRALIDKNADGLAVRRRVPLALLAAEAGLQPDQARKIIRPFRADGVSFFRPFGDEVLAPEDQIDVSHESLIRQWSKLGGFLKAESQAGLMWADLLRAMDQRDEAGLVTGKRLRAIQSWLDSEKPNKFWAERYGGRYTEAMSFLDDCAEEDRKQERRRKLLIAASVVGLVALPIGYGGGIVYLRAEFAEAEAVEKEARQQASRAVAAAKQEAAAAAGKAAEIEAEAAQQIAEAEASITQANQRIEAALERESEVRAERRQMIAQNRAIISGTNQISKIATDVITERTESNLAGVFVADNTPQRAGQRLSDAESEIGRFNQVVSGPVLRDLISNDAALALARVTMSRAEWHKLEGRPDCAIAEFQRARRLTSVVGIENTGAFGGTVPANCVETRIRRDDGATADHRAVIALINAQATAQLGNLKLSEQEFDVAGQLFNEAISTADRAERLQGELPDAGLVRTFAYAGLAARAAGENQPEEVANNAERCRDQFTQYSLLSREGSGLLLNGQRTEVFAALECFIALDMATASADSEAEKSRRARSEDDFLEALDDDPLENVMRLPVSVGVMVRAINAASDDYEFEPDTPQDLAFYLDFLPRYPARSALLMPTDQRPTSPDFLFTRDLVHLIRINSDHLIKTGGQRDRSEFWRMWARQFLLYRSLIKRQGWDDRASPSGLTSKQVSENYRAVVSRLESDESSSSRLSVLFLATEVAAGVSESDWYSNWPEEDKRAFESSTSSLAEMLASRDIVERMGQYPFGTPRGVDDAYTSPSIQALDAALALCARKAAADAACNGTETSLRSARNELEADARDFEQAIASAAKRRGGGIRNDRLASRTIGFEGVDLVATIDKLREGSEPGATLRPSARLGSFDYSRGLPTGVLVGIETRGDDSTAIAEEAIEAAEIEAAADAALADMDAVTEAAEIAAAAADAADEAAGPMRTIAPVIRGSFKFPLLHGNTVYLFSTLDNRTKFENDPDNYLERVIKFSGGDFEFAVLDGELVSLSSASDIFWFE